jgi:diguanylate cyclase (GGDEF)-like protein
MTRILVIEDTEPVRLEILRILSQAGYEASGAENGREGVQMASAQAPDLVVCDVMMPELDGYGVLTELRTNPDTRQVPFIFLTALDGHVDVRRGMNLGADDYLTKPFRVRELLDAVRSRLERRAELEPGPRNGGHGGSRQDAPTTDSLTGLPNRRQLQDWLQRCVALHEGGSVFGVLVIDLDRLRRLSDALGEEASDGMLKLIAERMQAGCPSLFRSGAGEFCAVVPDLAGERTATGTAATLLQLIKQPVSFGELTLNLTASIGVSLYPAHGTDPDTLLDHARLATRHAKE